MKKNLLNTIKEHKGAILKKVLLVAGSAVGIGLAATAFRNSDEDFEDYDPEDEVVDGTDDETSNEETEECNESEGTEEEAE